MPELVNLLVSYYRLSPEGAQEVLAELRDLTSLQSLAGGYRVARAVQSSTAHDFHG